MYPYYRDFDMVGGEGGEGGEGREETVRGGEGGNREGRGERGAIANVSIYVCMYLRNQYARN